eukprot:2960248-Rhodomonas_salina.1
MPPHPLLPPHPLPPAPLSHMCGPERAVCAVCAAPLCTATPHAVPRTPTPYTVRRTTRDATRAHAVQGAVVLTRLLVRTGAARDRQEPRGEPRPQPLLWLELPHRPLALSSPLEQHTTCVST